MNKYYSLFLHITWWFVKYWIGYYTLLLNPCDSKVNSIAHSEIVNDANLNKYFNHKSDAQIIIKCDQRLKMKESRFWWAFSSWSQNALIPVWCWLIQSEEKILASSSPTSHLENIILQILQGTYFGISMSSNEVQILQYDIFQMAGWWRAGQNLLFTLN